MLARIASTLAALAALASCSTTRSLDVTTEAVPGKTEKIASYKTYSWTEQPPGTDPNLYPPGVEKNVKDAVNRILGERGYREVSESPDFKIGWHAAIDTKLKQSSVNVHYGYYGGPFGMGVSTPVVQEYDVGTLLLDIADGASDELVWRGTANARIDRNVSDADKRKRIEKASAKILERFPPQQ